MTFDCITDEVIKRGETAGRRRFRQVQNGGLECAVRCDFEGEGYVGALRGVQEYAHRAGGALGKQKSGRRGGKQTVAPLKSIVRNHFNASELGGNG
jgi:hypothetical protein